MALEEIDLRKDEVIVLKKSLKELEINIEWENKGDDVDVDLACLCLDSNRKAISPVMKHFLFFNTPTVTAEGKLTLFDGGIIHSGDDLGDDDSDGPSSEQIVVNTAKIPKEVKEIMFIVTISNEDSNEIMTFKHTKNSLINVTSGGTIYANYDISDTFKRRDNSIIPGSLINNNGIWSFKALGEASEDDLTALLNAYCEKIVVKK